MDRSQKRWIIVITLAAIIVIGSLYSDWRKHSAPDPVPAGQRAETPRAGEAAEATVYISGAVHKPGLYKMPFGSRVTDAIAAAGGLTESADTAKLNLAQFVKDGMHVFVPAAAAPAPAKRTAAPAASRPAEKETIASKVNINSATEEQLEQLPGIGPVLAVRIVEYRKAKGPFRDIAELKLIPGIGDAKFNQLKDSLTL